MKSLFAIEWLKMRRYRTFWILSGLFLLLFPLWNYTISSSIVSLGGGKKGGINFLSSAYSFPGVWSNLGFWGSIFILFLSILVVILTTNEYTFRTHRQNIIDGWSRLESFHAKVFQTVFLSATATVFLILCGLVFGLTNGGADGIGYGWEKVGYFFLLSLNYTGFALLISILIRRSGLAIGLLFLYSFILENILRGLINWKSPQPFGDLLPLQSADELMPFPALKTLGTAAGMSSGFSPWVQVAVTIVWCGVYYLVGRRVILTRDL